MLDPLIFIMIQNPLHSFRYCPRCGQDGFADHGTRAKQCAHCGLSYYANVASAVALVVMNPKGELLFVRRAHEPAKGTLDLPGGFVDPMETVEQAAMRELREETGLVGQVCTYLMSLPNRYPFSGIDVYTSDLLFLVQVDSFANAVAADDAAELVIARLEQIEAKDFGLASISRFISILKEQGLPAPEVWCQ